MLPTISRTPCRLASLALAAALPGLALMAEAAQPLADSNPYAAASSVVLGSATGVTRLPPTGEVRPASHLAIARALGLETPGAAGEEPSARIRAVAIHEPLPVGGPTPPAFDVPQAAFGLPPGAERVTRPAFEMAAGPTTHLAAAAAPAATATEPAVDPAAAAAIDTPALDDLAAAPSDAIIAPQVFPIDLANALALGGAHNLNIRIARERVIEARAQLTRARAVWLPSLRGGIGYNKHDGRIQATEGDVIEADRNSLFVGGGAGLGGAPLAAGSGGPARLFVNLALADAFFRPMVAKRRHTAASAAATVALNDSLLAIASAYYDLVEAEGRRANARAGLDAASEMVRLTELFGAAGGIALAEVDRARTEQAHWQLMWQEAERTALARGAELARQLRLDARMQLVPVEETILPIAIFAENTPTDALVRRGLTARPELAEMCARVEAAEGRLRQEKWRPWLPAVQAGASGGTFEGGPGTRSVNAGGRSDVDLLAVWEWENLGVGNRAAQRSTGSQMRQMNLQAEQLADRIAAEIVTAARDAASYGGQIEVAANGAESAAESYRRNLERVGQGEGLPLELLQAIRARAASQDNYVRAVTDYNRAQFRLLRAVGRPPCLPGTFDVTVDTAGADPVAEPAAEPAAPPVQRDDAATSSRRLIAPSPRGG